MQEPRDSADKGMLRRGLKWLVVGIGFAVAGILAAAVVGFVVEYRRAHWLPPARWVGLGLFTAFGFGVIAVDFRRHWRDARFWFYLSVLLAAHLAGYIVLLVSAEEWRPIWFLPISLAEFPVVAHIMDVKMGRYDSLRRPR